MVEKTLQSRVILVTGASQGLGADVAKACAAAGATVVLMARSQKKLEKVYDAIVEAGSEEPFAVCFDMIAAEEKEFGQLARTVAEATGGRLDGIIHCASYFYALSPLDFQTVAEWVNQYRINTVAPMALTRAMLPMLKECGREPQRNAAGLLGRFRCVQSRAELFVQGGGGRMGAFSPSACQRAGAGEHQFAAARENASRGNGGRAQGHGGYHPRFCVVGKRGEQGAFGGDCVSVSKMGIKAA